MIRWLLPLAALLLAPAARAQDLARETAQVEDLRSIREIKRLQALWGHYALAGEWKAMAGLGTYYVEMVVAGDDPAGREAVEQWLRQGMGRGVDGVPAGRLNVHLWISPVITLSAQGDRATGRWHHISLTGENGVSAQWNGITDVVEYHKTPEGWRIAFIRPYHDYAGPYEGGWRTPATFERAPYHYTPDEAGTLLPDAPLAILAAPQQHALDAGRPEPVAAVPAGHAELDRADQGRVAVRRDAGQRHQQRPVVELAFVEPRLAEPAEVAAHSVGPAPGALPRYLDHRVGREQVGDVVV